MLERKENSVVFKDSAGNTTEVKLSDLPQHMIEKLAVYGLYTKLSKSRAGKNEPDTAVYKTIEALKGGKWTVSGGAKVSPTVRTSFETIKSTLEAVDPVIRKKILKSMKDSIKKMPEELQEELKKLAKMTEKEFKAILQ